MGAATGVDGLLSQRGHNVGESRGLPGAREGVISFSGGFPDPARFPYTEIAEATARTMQTHGQWPLQYGPSMGYEGMLDFLVEKLGKHQGIRCSRENLLLTAGGSQALALLCDLFVDQGDTVLSEAPTWMGAGRIFRNVGAEVESVPLDGEGTRVDALEERLRDLKARGVTPKFFYIIPNFQNPSGVTTTLARRQRIVELAAEYNFAILEDDAYFDLRFAGEKLPTLYTLDGGRRVFYFGTFSKILAAGMRLGWIVGDPAMIGRMGGLKAEGSTNPFAAHVAFEYCKDGRLDARITDLIETYRRRRDLTLGELDERMPEDVTWTVPDGGFFVWVTLPEGVDVQRLLPKAREAGLEFSPGPIFYFDGSGRHQLRLSYSYVEEDQLARGVQLLADLIREVSSEK